MHQQEAVLTIATPLEKKALAKTDKFFLQHFELSITIAQRMSIMSISHIRIPKIFAGGIPFRWTLSFELLLPHNQGIPLTFSG